MEQAISPQDGFPYTDLVRSAQAGDCAAFDALAHRCRAAVLAIAFLRTGNREEAEDLTQEVMVIAWQKLADLRDPEAFSIWLKAIALNACRSWHRRSRPWPESLDAIPETITLPDLSPEPLEAALLREKERAWRQVLRTLPEANRLALLMHVWGGCSYSEIASYLNIPLTTVEGRIHRAKKQLRRLLRSHAADLLGEPARRWQEEEK